MNRTLLLFATLALVAGLAGLALLVRGGDAAALDREEAQELAVEEARGPSELLAHEPSTEPVVGETGDEATVVAEAPVRPRPRRREAAGSADSIRFRLTDDRGEPIDRASFHLHQLVGQSYEKRDPRELSGTGGELVLAGLEPGKWMIRVTVVDHTQRPRRDDASYEVPHTGGPVHLVFDRNGNVLGRVIDGTGAAVRDIRVDLRSEGGFSRGGKTDEQGDFLFRSVPPGELTARASNDFVEASADFSLAPGDRLEGVEIRMAGGGYVHGRVLDRDSRPLAGTDVLVVDGVDFRSDVETGDGGEFRIGPITPGRYQVFAVLKRPGHDEAFEQLLSCDVTVAEGEVVDVLLQPDQSAPVKLHGRITLGRKPLPECVVYAFREDAGLLSTVRMGRADEEGQYSLELDRAGTFLFLFEPPDNSSNNPIAPIRARVPEVAEHRLDLDLPTGTIAGRVLDAAGEGVAGVKVLAERDDGYLELTLPDTDRGARTNQDGGYTILYLSPGGYTLRVAGAQVAGAHAWRARAGVEVRAGERIGGVDLRAEEGGGVRGIVRAVDGAPVQGAAVYLRDGSGGLLRTRPAVTDSDGRFELEAIPTGPVTASARAPGAASAESGAKEVRAGDWASFDLRLEPAGLLTVAAIDASGDPVSCSIRVHDAARNDVTHTSSRERAQGSFDDPLSTTRRTVGPLPSGRYTVSAARPDGRTALQTLRLSSGRDRTVELRFD